MTSSTTHDTQVLIIGAGVVGLSAALFLAQHDIRSMVVERRAGTSVHPRARSVNQRTVELFRHLGIDGLVHEAGKEIANSKGIYVGTSLQDVVAPQPRKEGQRTFPLASITEQFSPAKGTFVTQDKLEPVLVSTAERRGVDVGWNLEFQSLTQDGDTVTTTVQSRVTGRSKSILSDYVIAADGAKSPVCRHLGVQKLGRGAMGHMINILFRADLAAFVKGREFSLVKIRSPRVSGLFTSINNADRWVFHLSYNPSIQQSSDFSEESCVELVRLALGMPDITIKIESLLPWEPAVNVAEQMRYGRVFLAGDAAHQMPPWAGQGANSGFADVHNLAWKLAAVLNGRGGEKLLDTYNIERQPIGSYAAEASATGVDEMGVTDIDFWKSEVRRGMLMKLPIIAGFGYGYKSSSVCVESSWPLGGLTWKSWSLPSILLSLDGRPGRRVPHIWVEYKSRRVSTIDMVGKSFMMLVDVDGGKEWKKAASVVSRDLSVAIDVYTIGVEGDLVTNARVWNAAAGIASRGGLLVRPDDFVAKRWRRDPTNPTSELTMAVKQVLCL